MAHTCRLFRSALQPLIFLLLFVCLAVVLVYKTDVLKSGMGEDGGLNGMVSVKGTVSVEELGLSDEEVRTINTAVGKHAETFSKVDLFVDKKVAKSEMQADTVLIFAMVLETGNQLEVRSWSRQIRRGDLASQVVAYMGKAAYEYEKFKKYPDVEESFKRLYI